MRRTDLKTAASKQRQRLRQRLNKQRAEAQARMQSDPTLVRQAQRRRAKRLRRSVIAVALVLSALALRCECEEPVAPPAAPQELSVAPSAPKPPPPAPTKPALRGRINSRPRPAMNVEAVAPPGWLENLRMQVAARSPRLAECFNGTDRPGALKWSASINPQSGTVLDQDLEPVGSTEAPSTTQRACLTEALSRPAYGLSPEGGETLPRRISMMLEF